MWNRTDRISHILQGKHFRYQVELTNTSSMYCLWLSDEETWSYCPMISKLQIYHPQICYYREKTIDIPAR